MALAQRINGNNSASMGNTSGKLSQKDIIPIQPVSQSTAADDNKAQIMQITATPYATCSTASATATKQATMQNFPSDYSPVVGSKIKVKFTNANTAATQMYLKVGTLAAKPCTCRGIAMGAGSVLAGSKIEFMYDGEAWDCQLCEAISAMDTTSKSPINSTALNGALENYNKTFYGYSGSKYNLVISLNRLNHLGLMLKTENNNGSGSIYYITQNQNYKICGEDLTITKDTTANTITVRLVTNYCYCLIENITQNGTVENRTLINSFTFS